MIKKLTCQFLGLLIMSVAASNRAIAQNSLLVNFGASSCTLSAQPAFSFINNPIGVSPSALTNCSLLN